MRPLRWRVLVAVGTATFAVAAFVAWSGFRTGATPVRVPPTTLIVALLISVGVLYMGWAVRQLKRGKRRDVSPQRALRTAQLAQACAYAGAMLAGAYGGYVMPLLPDWGHAPRREAAIAAGVVALGGLVMTAAGVIAEHWCRVDPMDDDADGPGSVAGPVAH